MHKYCSTLVGIDEAFWNPKESAIAGNTSLPEAGPESHVFKRQWEGVGSCCWALGCFQPEHGLRYIDQQSHNFRATRSSSTDAMR